MYWGLTQINNVYLNRWRGKHAIHCKITTYWRTSLSVAWYDRITLTRESWTRVYQKQQSAAWYDRIISTKGKLDKCISKATQSAACYDPIISSVDKGKLNICISKATLSGTWYDRITSTRENWTSNINKTEILL